MSCQRFREAITDHACGAALDDASAAHLTACAACREAYDSHRAALSEVDALLNVSLSAQASADFTARVLERTHANRRGWVFPRRWAIGLAAAAALVLAVFLVWRQPDRPLAIDSRIHATTVNHPNPVASAHSSVASAPNPVASGFSRKDAAVAPRHASAARKRGPVPEPEVLVPPDQLRAITRLQQLLRGGGLDDTILPPQKSEAEALSALSIEPLTVPGIAFPDIEPPSRAAAAGERQ
jgi:hypothetical protein